jgi:hypothetical protein
MSKKKPLVEKAQALRLASDIGCSGAHEAEGGGWAPCASNEELQRISKMAETSKWRTVVPGYKKSDKTRTAGKRKKKRGEWEPLMEKPIQGIGSLEGGGIVSGVSFGGKSENNPCWPGFTQVGMKKGKAGKMVPNCVPIAEKSAAGPEFVRENDVDTFLDPESARARSRQLGCIGISRRVSKNGRTVWMPCTNMTDYANRAGSTDLGRRNMRNRRENEMRQVVRTVLRDKPKQTLKRKSSIALELMGK